jgi:serine/threonine protein kinase
LHKQNSLERLARIKSEQNIIHRLVEIVGKYRVGEVLGRGTYATVRLAKGGKGGTFAMKIYEKSKISNPTHMSNIKNEIAVMEQIHHDNIVKYYETITTYTSISIVMELL